MTPIEFVLNSREVTVEVRGDESLLETLRERCGVSSTKNGCQPQGQCGCCLVLMNGRPLVSCAVKASKAAGKEILTLEGLAQAERQQIADAFVAAAGLQCGFCIPGIVLRTKHLLDKDPDPDLDTIAKALDVHLCRCTGYTKIVQAVQDLARARRGESLVGPLRSGGVGERVARVGGDDNVLGERPYVADLRRPEMLHGAILQSEHARAEVLGIDTSAAEAIPGVIAVATAADVPGERWYGLIAKDWPGFVAISEEVRCVGDVLAAVAAVDEATARAACDAIVVDYRALEPIVDPAAAMDPKAPRVNPHHPNRMGQTVIRRGDAEAALASSAHVVEGTWQTQRIEHLYLEPEAALTEPGPRPGSFKLYSQGQGIFDDRSQVATFLDIAEDDFDVELVPNGGAFGGKEDLSIQAHSALLAQLTGKPVRLVLSREQSIRMHPKRHPLTMHYRVGCDETGLLTAIAADIIGDTGAYASVGAKVLERAAGHGCGPYRVANVAINATAVMTNNPPCGAMRGFGANQTSFAIEGCLDQLAEKVGIDGWTIRWRNALDIGDETSSGQILEASVGLKKTLEAVRPAWDAATTAGRAVGIGCAIKNSGIGNGAIEYGKCRLAVEAGGRISLYNGYTEMGQGLFTILVQIAAEVSGLPSSIFDPKVDSTFALACGQTTGSRATLFSGNAVIIAAESLKEALADRSLEELEGEVFAGDFVVSDTTAPGAKVDKVKTHTAFGYATQLCILDADGRVDRMIAAHDVGRAINPALCEGQIEGSVHMGLGFALTEELPCHEGMPVTFRLREIGVLRARDMPAVDVILVEDPEPEGPSGAKGVGEIGLVPTAGAVAGALAAFDGIRRQTLPMKDSPAARAMSVGVIRKRPENCS